MFKMKMKNIEPSTLQAPDFSVTLKFFFTIYWFPFNWFFYKFIFTFIWE